MEWHRCYLERIFSPFYIYNLMHYTPAQASPRSRWWNGPDLTIWKMFPSETYSLLLHLTNYCGFWFSNVCMCYFYHYYFYDDYFVGFFLFVLHALSPAWTSSLYDIQHQLQPSAWIKYHINNRSLPSKSTCPSTMKKLCPVKWHENSTLFFIY